VKKTGIMIPLEKLSSSMLAALTGQSLTLRTPAGGTCQVELTAVTPLGAAFHASSREPFSLTFRGPSGLRLPQSIYTFELPEIGEQEFFITQTADAADGSWFEAIFT